MCHGYLLRDWGSAFPWEAEMETGKDWCTHRLRAWAAVPGRAAHLQLILAVNSGRGGAREHTACVSFSCCTRRTSPRRGSCAESSSSFCPSQSMISWRGTCSFPLWSEKASSRALAGERGQQDSGQERSRFPREGRHSTVAGVVTPGHPQDPTSNWQHASAQAVHDPQPAQTLHHQVG